MVSEAEKRKITNQIYKMLKESIFENGYFENMFPEEKREKHHKDDGKENSDNTRDSKQAIVLKWLDSAQELHSVLARRLYPDLTDGGARSEFSKKYRGHDDEGNKYEFDDSEINKLYNMRDDFIEDAGLNDEA